MAFDYTYWSSLIGGATPTSNTVGIRRLDSAFPSVSPPSDVSPISSVPGTTAIAYAAFPPGTTPTLQGWMSQFGIDGSSYNTGTSQWNSGFYQLTFTDRPLQGNGYFGNNYVRFIQGDGSYDSLDWCVFYFQGPLGDFDGYSFSSGTGWFGGESSYSGSNNGSTVTRGRIWGYGPGVGWKLLYVLDLPGGSSFNHSNGNWFNAGGGTDWGADTSALGKRTQYDTLAISHVGFSVGTA